MIGLLHDDIIKFYSHPFLVVSTLVGVLSLSEAHLIVSRPSRFHLRACALLKVLTRNRVNSSLCPVSVVSTHGHVTFGAGHVTSGLFLAESDPYTTLKRTTPSSKTLVDW